MQPVPYCLWCGEREITLSVFSDGQGFCSRACQEALNRELDDYDRWRLDNRKASSYIPKIPAAY